MADDVSVSELVLAARDGQQSAWDELVTRFTPLVHGIVRRYRLQGSDVDDVVQTLWLRLVEHLDALREPAALPGWIVTTTRNECMRLLRARRRTQPVDPLGTGVDHEAPEALRLDEEVLDDLDHAERHELLLRAFAELSEQHRTLLLVLVQDPPPSYAEVSARLGIPVGSIGPTRARALQRIREFPAVAAWIAASEEPEGSRPGPSR